MAVHEMKIAYLILAHQHPALLARLIRRLLDAGGIVAIHFDRNAGDAPVDALRELLGPDFERLLLVDRVAVVWGEWSLVQATLNGLQAIAGSGRQPGYVCLLSGSDYPIRPLDELRDFLERNKGKEFIESFCDKQHFWVKRGIQAERYLYRFPFNWGTHPRLFALALKVQKLLRWKRRVPAGIDPHFGSQWWVLSWASCTRILELCGDRALLRFFKGTWVPDELFFQTLIRKVARPENIRSYTLTLYQFTDCGTPVVYCNGHEEYLARENFFFARKISPWADRLRDRLDAIAAGDREAYRFADQAIGKRRPDYQDHCRIYGHGVFDKPVMGRIADEALGDLAWNRKPYFVVAGFSFREMKAFQDYLNGLDGVICHGQLFHPEHIDFLDYADRYAGLSRQDVPLRDHNIANFLVQVLQQDGERKVAFLLNPVTQKDAIETLALDPNARVIVLQGDPVQAFLEAGGGQTIPAGANDQAHGGILQRQEALASLFIRHYESGLIKMHLFKRLLGEGKAAVLHIRSGAEVAGEALTAQHLDDFYHNRLAARAGAGGGATVLHFSSGPEPAAESAALQRAREAVDQYIMDRIRVLEAAVDAKKAG